MWFTAGVHPHDASTLEEEGQVGIEALKGMLNHERCVAVGECGLDFNRNLSPPAVQERWFEEQVKLAIAAEKPLFLHCREAVDSLARILGKYAPLPVRAVAHCFTGDVTEAFTLPRLRRLDLSFNPFSLVGGDSSTAVLGCRNRALYIHRRAPSWNHAQSPRGHGHERQY